MHLYFPGRKGRAGLVPAEQCRHCQLSADLVEERIETPGSFKLQPTQPAGRYLGVEHIAKQLGTPANPEMLAVHPHQHQLNFDDQRGAGLGAIGNAVRLEIVADRREVSEGLLAEIRKTMERGKRLSAQDAELHRVRRPFTPDTFSPADVGET